MPKIFKDKRFFVILFSLVLFLSVGLIWNSKREAIEVSADTSCVSGGGLTCTQTTYGSYTINKYTGSGTYSWTAPTGVNSVQYLVVGGGGGAATGGGGAGGFNEGTLSVTPGNPYTVTIGVGGTGSSGGAPGGNGGNSVFASITGVGGGGGGMTNNSSASNGGCGGGGGGVLPGSPGSNPGGLSTQSSYGGYGYAGGAAGTYGTGYVISGGGGGAGAIGGSPTMGGSSATNYCAAGGAGRASSITGTSTYYAGGGGSGSNWGQVDTSHGGGAGGIGGGGTGVISGTGGAGTTNTGGGAGGGPAGSGGAGGAGGSGVVIIRYLTPDTTAPTIAQVTAVPSPTSDTTPNYTFSSTEAGTITYGGDCSSATTAATAGNNTITFNTLSNGTHSNCTIRVTDATNNQSPALSVNSFIIESFSSYTSTNLTCSLISGATCSGTTIFNLYASTGGHAELSSQSNYPYKVCCTGTGISNSCSGNYDTILKLSSATNAHAEKKTQSNYSDNNVCLHSDSMAVSCDYSTDCSLLGTDYVCIASISGDTNAHIGECSTYSTKACCNVGIFVDACTARVASNKSISLKDTDIQLCSGADTANPSDPCYSVCWKGTGSPVVTSSDWKCGVCHDSGNNPVSCSTAASTTFNWVMPTGYATPANYTLVSGTLTTANPIVRFTAQDSNRQLTLNIGNFNTTCSGLSSKQSSPIWKEVSPF